MAKRTNWKALYRELEGRAATYIEERRNAERERDVLQAQMDSQRCPWSVKIDSQEFELTDGETEKVKALIDAGLWFLKLSKVFDKWKIEIRAQTISWRTKGEAEAGMKALMNARIWFLELRRQ